MKVFATLAIVACTVGVAVAAAGVAWASDDPAAEATPLPPALQVGFDQNLGGQVPLDLVLRDEDGAKVRLGDLFQGRPVILSLAWYDCPMLCGMALQGIASSLKPLSLTPGREFEVITVSFDPKDTPAKARAARDRSLDFYGHKDAAPGWRFLTADPDAIRSLTTAVGFRYVWDADEKQFAHPTGVVLLTPQGKIARYFFGIDYAARDLRLGLFEASAGKIGTLADKLLLLCYRYDPKTGRYGAMALNLVRGAGVLTLLVLGGGITLALRRERRAARAAAGRPTAAGGTTARGTA